MRFGVSHTPVREALVALAGIGVIDLVPNRGAVVRQVTPKEVREVCQVRRALECEAVRMACGRISDERLDELADGFRRVGNAKRPDSSLVGEARRLDTQLHDSIAQSCGNPFLAREISRLTTLFRAFRDMAWDHDSANNDYRRLAQEAAEHLEIVESLRSGDRVAARRAMARHIRSGIKYWSRALPNRAKPLQPKPRSRQ